MNTLIQFPGLPYEEIHIWYVNHISLNAAIIQVLYESLSLNERTRIDRFRFASDKQDYLISRGMLRRILGAYLDVLPENVKINLSCSGKPFLSESQNKCDLRFNLSHSRDLTVYAFSCERVIGVDVEYLQPMASLDTIIKEIFTKRETFILEELEVDEKTRKFYDFWTIKEAYSKAIGLGLHLPFDTIDVSTSENGLSKIYDETGKFDNNFLVKPLFIDLDYVGNVVFDGDDSRMLFFSANVYNGGK